MNKEEYNTLSGLNTIDIGSRKLLLREIVKMSKKIGYHTSGFHKMKIKQLKAIYYKLINKF
jgi:hypothetical protein